MRRSSEVPLRRHLAALFAFKLAFALLGCTTPTQDRGVALAPDAAPPQSDAATSVVSPTASSDCAPGSFESVAEGDDQARECAPCPSGSFSTVSNAPVCVPWRTCPPGSFVREPGSSVRDRQCETCAAETESTELNQSHCTPIPPCEPGSARPLVSGSAQCEPCEVGTHCPGGTVPKAICGPGTWDDDADSRTPCRPVSDCAPGTRVVVPGTATTDRVCTGCLSGSFSTQQNAASCTDWRSCAPGTFVLSPGTAMNDRTCEPCAPGMFSTQFNQSACVNDGECPAGSILVNVPTPTDPAVCASCQAGSFCAGGTASAQACPSGMWDNDLNPASPCVALTACLPGERIANAGSATADRQCIACAAGTFSVAGNASACAPWTACEPGSFVNTNGSSSTDRTCVACPAGTYANAPNQASCQPHGSCPAGTVFVAQGTPRSEPQCDACEAGTYCAGGMATKQACGASSWDHDGASSSACVAWTECAPGTFVSTNGSALIDRVCSACPAGTTTTSANASACVSTLTVSLASAPAALSTVRTLASSVSGTDVAEWRSAFSGVAADCDPNPSWSSWTPVATPLSVDLGYPGPKLLCLQGRNAAGTQLSEVRQYRWELEFEDDIHLSQLVHPSVDAPLLAAVNDSTDPRRQLSDGCLDYRSNSSVVASGEIKMLVTCNHPTAGWSSCMASWDGVATSASWTDWNNTTAGYQTAWSKCSPASDGSTTLGNHWRHSFTALSDNRIFGLYNGTGGGCSPRLSSGYHPVSAASYGVLRSQDFRTGYLDWAFPVSASTWRSGYSRYSWANADESDRIWIYNVSVDSASRYYFWGTPKQAADFLQPITPPANYFVADYSRAMVRRIGSTYHFIGYHAVRQRWEHVLGKGPDAFNWANPTDLGLPAVLSTPSKWFSTTVQNGVDCASPGPSIHTFEVFVDSLGRRSLYLFYRAGDIATATAVTARGLGVIRIPLARSSLTR
jgi:hypothetical protein